MTKKIFCLLLAAAICLGLLSACGRASVVQEDVPTRIFTDSAGRDVEIPEEITRIAPSGAVATMFLAAAAPEYMVCISSTPSSAQFRFLPSELIKLPTTGQLYGAKSTINLEALMSAEPQVIIDMGDAKDGIVHDMDSLQRQTGIPVIFLEADLDDMASAFRSLGQILCGKEDRCEALASYVDETVALAEENAAKIPEEDRVSVMYTSGTSGLNTNSEGSTQAQVIDMVGAKNAIYVKDVSDKGGDNTINMEQLYNFDPDVILFAAGSMYSACGEDPAWSKLTAVQSGRYYEIPSLPYNWMSMPPSMNMLLGIRWLGNLLYPEVYDYDMVSEAQRAYALLWGYDLSQEEARDMLANSSLKANAD